MCKKGLRIEEFGENGSKLETTYKGPIFIHGKDACLVDTEGLNTWNVHDESVDFFF